MEGNLLHEQFSRDKKLELVASPFPFLLDANIELNPHQINAFCAAIQALKTGGIVLADEVGLGKTIEAGLVLKYVLESGAKRVLIALPASLRKQWELELEDKFGLESVILDRLTVEKDSSDWRKRLTDNKSVRIVLTSYDYSSKLMKRFPEVKWDFIIIDEAHNLVERGREMYSAGISRQSLVALRKKIRKRFSKLARTLDKANRQMMELEENLAETGKGYQVLPNPGVLPITFLTISGELEEILEEKELEEELRREILEFYFIVRDFLNVSELVDENYVVYTENSAEEGFRLRLFCVNPAENLGEYLKKGKSAIFFSATMFPMLYYRELLTTDRDAYGIYVQSPFPKENRRILIGSDVSSRYTRRNRAEYRKIAGYIARCVWQRQGNYMVFFPSYRLMEDVLQVYEEEFSVDWVRCVCQTPDMTEQEREGFLEEFQEREGTLVGFCVLGGIFSEGVDLPGESLIGAVFVGTGRPQIGIQREILKEYYDKKNHCGFDYAYRYPGMNKVLQAAGRVIRTKEDKGVILLLDDRFWDRDYQEIFPREWQDRTGCRLDTVEGAVETFWKRFT